MRVCMCDNGLVSWLVSSAALSTACCMSQQDTAVRRQKPAYASQSSRRMSHRQAGVNCMHRHVHVHGGAHDMSSARSGLPSRAATQRSKQTSHTNTPQAAWHQPFLWEVWTCASRQQQQHQPVSVPRPLHCWDSSRHLHSMRCSCHLAHNCPHRWAQQQIG